jgi:hypothetical protein
LTTHRFLMTTTTSTQEPTTTEAPTTEQPTTSSTTQEPTTTQAPTTTSELVTKTAKEIELQEWLEIRSNLMNAFKELTKVTINQYSIQERQVIHERRSEIRKEIRMTDRKIRLLQGSIRGHHSPSLEGFGQYDSLG